MGCVSRDGAPVVVPLGWRVYRRGIGQTACRSLYWVILFVVLVHGSFSWNTLRDSRGQALGAVRHPLMRLHAFGYFRLETTRCLVSATGNTAVVLNVSGEGRRRTREDELTKQG